MTKIKYNFIGNKYFLTAISIVGFTFLFVMAGIYLFAIPAGDSLLLSWDNASIIIANVITILSLLIAFTGWIAFNKYEMTHDENKHLTNKWLAGTGCLQLLASLMEAVAFVILIVVIGAMFFADVLINIFNPYLGLNIDASIVTGNPVCMTITVLGLDICWIIITMAYKYFKYGKLEFDTIGTIFMALGFSTFTALLTSPIQNMIGSMNGGIPSLWFDTNPILTPVFLIIGVSIGAVGIALDLYIGNLVSAWELMTLTLKDIFFKDSKDAVYKARACQAGIQMMVGMAMIIFACILIANGFVKGTFGHVMTPQELVYRYMVGTFMYAAVYPIAIKYIFRWLNKIGYKQLVIV